MRLLFLNILIVVVLSCNAQDESTSYVNKIKSLCPDANIIEIETKEDYVEIEYLCGNKVVETGLNFDSKIIYTETETTIKDKTLSKIKNKLDKRYFGWTIDEFTLVEICDTSFYKAEILHDGIEENVYFTIDGKYYKAKNMVLNESWDISSLKKNNNYNNGMYDLTQPDKSFDLPEILVEISGIAVLNDTDVLCIQDEIGVVFSYNLQKEEINKIYRFTDVGDFEDITIFNDSVYIMRSDGTIFSFDYMNYSGTFDSKILPINCTDIEGLFYDKAKNKYLIACKNQLVNQKSSLRHIFSLNKNSSASPEIEITIDLKQINTFFHNQYDEFDTKLINLNPSSVSVHPITGEIFILSASNRLLAIYQDKQLKNIFPLPEELFYKPEGIGFATNGDMLISSEGNKKGYVGGQIHYFKWKN